MFQKLSHQITQIDTGLMGPGNAACYLLESDGEAAVIETGTEATTARILTLLNQREMPLKAVRFVIPTHVHLDYAGGGG